MPTIEQQMIALLNDPAALYDKLNAEPEFVRAQDQEGRTLLHHAFTWHCYSYHEDNSYFTTYQPMQLIKESWCVLLTSPLIDPNIQDNHGTTPIHRMVHTFHELRYVPYFIDGMLNDLYSRLNIHCSVDYSRLDFTGQSALHYAVRGNSYLLGFRTDSEIRAHENKKCTLISNALLKYMNISDINLTSNDGFTALSCAIELENTRLACCLLDHGANPYLATNCFAHLNVLKSKIFEPKKEVYQVNSPKKLVDFFKLEKMMNSLANQFNASVNTIKATKTVFNQARKSGCYPFTLFSNEVINRIAKFTNESKLITKADITDNFARYRK